MSSVDPHSLFERILSGDRFALSKGLTLIESTLESDKIKANELLVLVSQCDQSAYRIAISGAPGVGKSTFIEYLGMYLVNQGKKVAVLTIDPSSRETHGSILGDKTRMELLGKHKEAYIRPSPSAGIYGGIGLCTYESTLLCEAAGYDIVLIETVGVGQSEGEGKYVADLFTLLIQPGAGDDLQSMKKGIMENADCIIITKHDGDLKRAAEKTQAQYRSSWKQTMDRNRVDEILLATSHEPNKFSEIWNHMDAFLKKQNLAKNRRNREVFWFDKKLREAVISKYMSQHHDQIENLIQQIRDQGLFYLSALRSLLPYDE